MEFFVYLDVSQPPHQLLKNVGLSGAFERPRKTRCIFVGFFLQSDIIGICVDPIEPLTHCSGV